MQRFRGGLVFKAHRLCVSLNSRLESNKEEEKGFHRGGATQEQRGPAREREEEGEVETLPSKHQTSS